MRLWLMLVLFMQLDYCLPSMAQDDAASQKALKSETEKPSQAKSDTREASKSDAISVKQNSPAPGADEPDLGPWILDMQRKVKTNWILPKGNEAKVASVLFKVNRRGELSNLRIDRSSGLPIVDQAALKAVESAAPFQPLPKGYSKDNVDVNYVFVNKKDQHPVYRQF